MQKNWIFTLHESLPQGEFIRMVVTLWAVWRARRAIHEEIFDSPFTTNSFILSFLRDLEMIDRGAGSATKRASLGQHSWLPPPEGHAKMNVDAAVSLQGEFGAVGAVCRDQQGRFLGASILKLEFITDVSTLKAIAVREGQSLAEDLYENSIQLATDCKMVVEDVQKNSAAGYRAIVHEIILLANAFSSCKVVHEFRSSNFEAHNLARYALSLNFGRHVWLGQPGNLEFIPVNIMGYE